jgi:hypothetical protein
MSGLASIHESPALIMNISIETIFGQIRYLELIAAKLQRQGVHFASDLVELSPEEFDRRLGRVTDENRRRIEARMAELGLRFTGRGSLASDFTEAKQ